MRIVTQIAALFTIVCASINSAYAQANNDCGLGFQCHDGECIVNLNVCDGKRDCADSSDEVFATCVSFFCPHTAFRCNYGACIDGNKICDRINNCVDGSDEDPKLCGAITWPSLLLPVTSSTIYPTPTYHTIAPTPGLIKYCKAPAQPPNGHWKLHRSQCLNNQNDCDISEGFELPSGSHLIYSCNPGYKIRGSVDVSCSLNGTWLNIPVCTEIRCKSLSTASTEASCRYYNDWVSCESPVLPRTTATLTCRNSYRRETSISTRRDRLRCNSNGQWEPEPIQCIPVCGTLPADVAPLITNGTRPTITEFPWHASMYHETASGEKRYICGASIIKENLLITAAHCVYDEATRSVIKNPSKIHIVTGNIFRDYDSTWQDERLVKKNQVKNIYIPCNYLGLVGNYMWDIAILELVQPFVLSTWLVPICIDPSTFGDLTILEAGSYGKVAGFGRTAMGDSSAILKAMTVQFVSYNQCKAKSQDTKLHKYITIDKFCAGHTNGSSVCDDSGGGLAFKSGDLWYLRGIVSVSLGVNMTGGTIHCNNNSYSLYTRVSSHIEWIQDVIGRLEQNRPYPLCPDKS